MSKIKAGPASVVLSREAIVRFMQDELVPYGTFADMKVTSVVACEENDDRFLTVFLDIRPVKAGEQE